MSYVAPGSPRAVYAGGYQRGGAVISPGGGSFVGGAPLMSGGSYVAGSRGVVAGGAVPYGAYAGGSRAVVAGGPVPYGGYGGGDADCCGSGTGYGPGYGGGYGYRGGGGTDCCGTACGTAACAGVGCGGAACGGGGGGAILTWVGNGGDFVQETTYRYVGGGAGTFAVVPIGARANWCLWCIPLGLCLLLLPLLLLLLTGSGTTTTTTTGTPPTGGIVPPPTPGGGGIVTPPPTGPTGSCIIRGDPHVTTFDGRHISFYSRGEYWVVRSNSIWIQARYMPTPVTHGLSATKEIAFGGPFLDGKILRVSALTASFDGTPILTTFPSQFTNTNPAIVAEYNSEGAVLQHGRQGKPLRIVHLGLPSGVSVQINRWNEPGEGDYINVMITMPQQPAQDGHCGNFNGNIEDDRRLAIRARVGTTGVAPNELLFNTKTPVVAPQRPDLNNCPEEKANHAKALCKKVSKTGMADHDCMIDVCFGGDQFAYENDYE